MSWLDNGKRDRFQLIREGANFLTRHFIQRDPTGRATFVYLIRVNNIVDNGGRAFEGVLDEGEEGPNVDVALVGGVSVDHLLHELVVVEDREQAVEESLVGLLGSLRAAEDRRDEPARHVDGRGKNAGEKS